MKLDVFFDGAAQLGEGPRWHAAAQELHWVDIERGEIHRVDADAKHHEVVRVGQSVGAAVPRAAGGWIAALRDGVALLDGAGDQVAFAAVDERGSHRLNDGLCDTTGRFWAGTLDEEHGPASDALYSFSSSLTPTTEVAGIGLSNGIGWSPDDRTMYRVDSACGTIFRSAFDASSGWRGPDEVFAVVDASDGEPDGLTVDSEGCVWVAIWDGWRVVRYAPDGSIVRNLRVPVSRPTSCVFGGSDLTTLFITSARTGLSEADLAAQPWAGHVLACDTDVVGLPTNLFPS